MREHKLQILADAYLPVDEMGIPYQGLKDVSGAPALISARAKPIAEEFLSDDDQRAVKGYDHAFLLQAKGDVNQPAAQVWSADEKLQMTVYTTAPALQFYSGNYLGGTTAREHEEYSCWQGLALESEFLPDSPNHPEWPQPDCVLRPGREVRQRDGISFYSALIFSPPPGGLFSARLAENSADRRQNHNPGFTSILHSETIFAMVRVKRCWWHGHGNIMRIVIILKMLEE